MPKATVFKSPVPYSEKFDTTIKIQDFYNILLFQGQRVIVAGGGTSVANSIIYTVPSGRTLFIIAANLQGTCATANQHSSQLFIDSTQILRITLNAITGQTSAVSVPLSFSTFPLRVQAGESLRIFIDADGNTNYNVFAYEINNALLQKFY